MQLPKPTEGGSFELVPAGTHIATCYRFIDRGTQMTEYMGDKKTRREVMITWELPDEEMADGRPFSVSKTYTWSMHEKATLRKHLEAWRGKAFTDDDFDGETAFNTKNLLGKSCMLSITHETKGDKIYATIAGVGKLVKGVQVKPLTNSIAYLALSLEAWNPEVYSSLSDRMREVIAASPEYKDLSAKLSRHDDPGANGGGYLHDDDIPF